MFGRAWRKCAPRSLPFARAGLLGSGTRRLFRTTTLTANAKYPATPFPGAPKSPLTTKMDFFEPSSVPPRPTYHVMDSSGNMADLSRKPLDVTNEQVHEWYENMLTVNIMDSIMFEAQKHGRLSFYMVSAGEEAVMVGSAAALTPTDVITCQYRETGVFLQRGFTLADFMSQLAANHEDPGKGRNMPVHYSGKKKVNEHAVASTLATQIPHATGAAYALKLDAQEDPCQPPSVAACYFGDGAASEGDFHAALNVAAVRKCPILFLCRNNGFAISTPVSEQYVGDGIAVRGLGYGIPSIRVDGTDIFAVYEATREARRRALEGGGQPVLLELMSYRISHHSTSDDSMAYRSQAEVQTWKTGHNPVTRLKGWLENNGLWNEEKDKEAKARIRKSVLRGLVEAEKKPKPRLSGVFDDVLMNKYPEEYDINSHLDGIKGL
ncbi:thiamine diphosphate-binding protein [Aspergillus pseudoustus]|uniref:2-oxoisovalerate dehydrogenase subunit alpha n=1 Tax=Aspergillus pseudoustus TaxID=1810923 RepID=A0ABR4J8W7_9EURO